MGYFSHCQGKAFALWGSEEAHHRRVCEAEVSGVLGLCQAMKCSERAGLVQKVLDCPFLTLPLEVWASCSLELSPWWTIPGLGQTKHKALAMGCAQSRMPKEWLLCLQHTR